MDMQNLTARTEKLIDALTGAIMSTAETAAERIQLAALAAQATQRMAAFTSVLEAVAAQKAPLLERLANLSDSSADRVMAVMTQRHIDILSAQEVSLLERAGAPREAASQAVDLIDHQPDTVRVPSHTRRKPGRNGTPVNGAPVEG